MTVNHSQATRKLRKDTKLTKQSINVAQFNVTLQKNAQTRKLIKFTKHIAKMIKRQHFKQLLRFIMKIVSL